MTRSTSSAAASLWFASLRLSFKLLLLMRERHFLLGSGVGVAGNKAEP